MDVFERAVCFAAEAHSGTVRKQEKTPYLLHLLEVATIIGTMSADRELLAAGVLHDTVEDAGVEPEELERLFGARVAALVATETENKRRGTPSEDTWEQRKRESLEELSRTDDPAVKMLWLGDKLSNMRSIYRSWERKGNAVWQGFHQKDPARQAWYYRTVAELLRSLSDYPAWQEYDALVRTVFADVEE